MNACIFLGPTLPISEARAILDADYRPPVAHGDVYRATLQEPQPRVIGIIDGYFRHRAAVRHKEILWALSQGIAVFGAASIGALRAAELADFGMIGIGQIFEDFRDGLLEDDDEVAVDHGPAELGYPAVNLAMVDIRATLTASRAQGVISEATERVLIDIGKRCFYPDRSIAVLVEQARRLGAPEQELDRLAQSRTIGAKHSDAVTMLKAIDSFMRENRAPPRGDFRLAWTDLWEADVKAARSAPE